VQYVPQVTRPVSGRTATRTQGCLTPVCSAPGKRSPRARLPVAARALARQHSPGVSAFPARLVRPPCDSCPAWRLVTRTHRLMLVSPRKQKATVGRGRCCGHPVSSDEAWALPAAPDPHRQERPGVASAAWRHSHCERGARRARPGCCWVTTCKAVPTWASVPLFVQGGCETELIFYDKLSCSVPVPLCSQGPLPPGPTLPAPLVSRETSVLWFQTSYLCRGFS